MAIAESLAHSIPVITTKGAPWPNLEEKKCGWSVARTQENITHALSDAMNIDIKLLHGMGANGREWMMSNFSWDSVARQMIEFYQWSNNGGTTPKFVIVD